MDQYEPPYYGAHNESAYAHLLHISAVSKVKSPEKSGPPLLEMIARLLRGDIANCHHLVADHFDEYSN